MDRISSASSSSSSSSTKSNNSEMPLDPLHHRSFTISKKSSSTYSNPNDIMEQFSSMSKQYLQIITAWCTCLLIMNCVYIAFAFFDFEKNSSPTYSNNDDSENHVNWLDSVSSQKKSSCIAIGVLMHYFLLCSFCFSMCITLIQFFIVYRSFSIFNWLFLKSSIFSFGILFFKQIKIRVWHWRWF